MGVKQVLSETKLLVHVLVCVFGIASWVDINGLWVQLPILVTHLPEKWTLPSFIVIISQIANVGPIIFGILVFLCKSRKLEKPTSAIIICVGILACLLLSFFWKHTSYMFGELHASALFVLSFMLSVVDCTSSMAFLAFMSRLKPAYLSSFFVGEGLSGMVPSLLSLAQGAGSITCVNGSSVNATFINGTWHNVTEYSEYPMFGTPRFSVQVFFLLLAALITGSLVSFLFLNFHPYCKEEHVEVTTYSVEQISSSANPEKHNPNLHFDVSDKESYGATDAAKQQHGKKLSTPMFIYLMLNTSFLTMQINTFLLSVQSYTSLPYGLETYHLVATITNIANPVASFTSLLFPLITMPAIILLTVVGTGFSIYLITLAAMSPYPPLVGTHAGGAVAITCWAFAGFFLVYAKVSIAGRLRHHGGRRSLLWYGAFTQIGSMIGAITAFLIVNVYHVLKDAPYC